MICSCAEISVTEKNRMAIKSCESNSNCVILIAAVSWVQTNGSEQDSGMHCLEEDELAECQLVNVHSKTATVWQNADYQLCSVM